MTVVGSLDSQITGNAGHAPSDALMNNVVDDQATDPMQVDS